MRAGSRIDFLCIQRVFKGCHEVRSSSPCVIPPQRLVRRAYDVEVKAALLSRTICGQKIVMFRRKDASVAALEDACWHRLLPLSKGTLHDDEITCGYHGLVFNGDGRCTHMPSQETINPSACVRSFPVVQKHRFIWVWPGDPALADESKVPDLHWNDDPAWAGDGKLITREVRLPPGARQPDGPDARDLRARLQHRPARRGRGALRRHARRQTATVTRWMEGIDATPFWAGQLKHATGATRAWSTAGRSSASRRLAPIAIDVGVAPTGTGAPPKGDHAGDRSQGVNGYVLNTITPETDGTLPLLLGLRAQLLPGRAAPHARSARRASPASSEKTS
jgi:vanillate O-demethylase monooxygenase subunit